jgi:hypothetical protein
MMVGRVAVAAVVKLNERQAIRFCEPPCSPEQHVVQKPIRGRSNRRSQWEKLTGCEGILHGVWSWASRTLESEHRTQRDKLAQSQMLKVDSQLQSRLAAFTRCWETLVRHGVIPPATGLTTGAFSTLALEQERRLWYWGGNL